jgi:hypothetical protein
VDEDRPELRSRPPEIKREQSLVLKWLSVAVACFWGAAAIALAMGELAPSIAIYFVTLFAIAIFPLAKAFRHIHVWVQLDGEYRRRYSIRYDNRLVQFAADRPYLGGGIVIGVVFLLVAGLALLGG